MYLKYNIGKMSTFACNEVTHNDIHKYIHCSLADDIYLCVCVNNNRLPVVFDYFIFYIYFLNFILYSILHFII